MPKLHPSLRPNLHRRVSSAGQAMVEYLLGVGVLVTLLTVPFVDGRPVAEALMRALSDRYAVLSAWLAIL